MTGTRTTSTPAGRLPARYTRILAAAHVGFLTFAVVALAEQALPVPATVLAALGIAAFGALFVRIVWAHLPRPHANRTPYALAGMVVVAVAVQTVMEATWLLTALYYLITMVVFSQPPRRWPLGLAGIPVAGVAAGVVRLGDDVGTSLSRIVPVLVYGVLLAALYLIIRMNGKLRAARIELARGAVDAERARIARDLHDVLGQRLTAIVLKAELSARLVTRDPPRAAVEMASVGRAAREVLDEVRATVTGYREISLAGEIATAREIAEVAGLELDVHVPDRIPGGEAGQVLAWAVREGLTNVLRHAAAGTCVIGVTADGPAVVTVADDGPARGGGAGTMTYGAGLTGLAERAGALGGRLEVSADDAWFTLRAEVPEEAEVPGEGEKR
ncbi:sensor histidine kinase [Nonomuraea longicatena]|uniref:Signal transduction histidine kinase subgroup 3 dimerisation and phosphoacceptor domain-containing protein n=1 Tax=Nonomuraea longicatena TaxID=83682 RepID=A0ABP4BK18_9ACTN